MPVAKDRIILGIDPGTNVMGYGLISIKVNKMIVLDLGVLQLKKLDSHALKLKMIFEKTLTLIDQYHPDELAIEAPFFGKNIARGELRGAGEREVFAHGRRRICRGKPWRIEISRRPRNPCRHAAKLALLGEVFGDCASQRVELPVGGQCGFVFDCPVTRIGRPRQIERIDELSERDTLRRAGLNSCDSFSEGIWAHPTFHSDRCSLAENAASPKTRR